MIWYDLNNDLHFIWWLSYLCKWNWSHREQELACPVLSQDLSTLEKYAQYLLNECTAKVKIIHSSARMYLNWCVATLLIVFVIRWYNTWENASSNKKCKCKHKVCKGIKMNLIVYKILRLYSMDPQLFVMLWHFILVLCHYISQCISRFCSKRLSIDQIPC